MVSDRLTGGTFGSPQTHESLWSQNGWRGSITFNDNHVEFADHSEVEGLRFEPLAAPLLDRAINSGLLEDSIRTPVLDEIELMVTDDRDLKPYALVDGEWVPDPDPAVHNKRDGLMYCVNDQPCPASRTGDVVKAVCTTVLGSAVVMAQ